MSDRASNTQNSVTASRTLPSPLLHPAPGRAILRIVPRILEAETTEGKVIAALDGRYQNQPMVGSLVAIGDPTSERERVIADWAIKEYEAGNYFIFSQYGAGSPYWDDDMRKMEPLGYDFGWLKGYRLFDIGQLAATVSGTGAYGQRLKEESKIDRVPLIEIVQ